MGQNTHTHTHKLLWTNKRGPSFPILSVIKEYFCVNVSVKLRKFVKNASSMWRLSHSFPLSFSQYLFGVILKLIEYHLSIQLKYHFRPFKIWNLILNYGKIWNTVCYVLSSCHWSDDKLVIYLWITYYVPKRHREHLCPILTLTMSAMVWMWIINK